MFTLRQHLTLGLCRTNVMHTMLQNYRTAAAELNIRWWTIKKMLTRFVFRSNVNNFTLLGFDPPPFWVWPLHSNLMFCKQINKQARGCRGGRPTYRPERPKGAKDEVKRLASKADYSRPSPRQTYRPEHPKGAKDEVKRLASKAHYGISYSRPKHSNIHGATSISDAFIFLKTGLPSIVYRNHHLKRNPIGIG